MGVRGRVGCEGWCSGGVRGRVGCEGWCSGGVRGGLVGCEGCFSSCAVSLLSGVVSGLSARGMEEL